VNKNNMSTTETQYRPFPATFRKNGFHYELMKREGDIAMVKQRLEPGRGLLAYEILRIRRAEAREMHGKAIEAAEYGPCNEDFGKHGWSYPTIERAEAKFSEMVCAEAVAKTTKAK
jgi:hypothetical protein